MFDTTLIAYTPEQTAEILQLSKNTVYELIAKGEKIIYQENRESSAD